MKKKGFTLVELLAVIAILAILVVIALPNVLSMFNSAKKDLFLTEARNLYKESANKYISDFMHPNGSGNIYCQSETDSLNPLDVTASDIYYYIEKNSSGDTKKVVVWNSQGFVIKQLGDNIELNNLDSGLIEEKSTSGITCGNVLSKLEVIPELTENYTVVGSIDVTNTRAEVSVFVSDSSSNTDFNKVRYVVYRKLENRDTGEKDTDFVRVGEFVQTNKSEDFVLTYIDNDINYNTYVIVDYKIESYTENGLKIGEVLTNYTYCFVAGTKVKTENGFKNIEDIKIGDKVYSYNLENNELELKTVTHLIRSTTIDTYKVTIGGKTVEMSPKHQIYVIDKGWIRAYDMKVGDKMLSLDNEQIEVTNIEYIKYDKPIKTYNLTVDGNSNYFVTDIQVLVHNAPSRT